MNIILLKRSAVFRPAYLDLYEQDKLKDRIKRAYSLLKNCSLCPRECHVNRMAGETGFCKTGRWPIISSYGPHFGEEDPLVGSGGSGTIFFTNCNLLCVFCQNHEISHRAQGEELAIEGLAEIMIRLQAQGCHNINFVTPTHVTPMILEALPMAIERGLNLPLVYNSSGYDKMSTLRLLNGVFDIYMPDFKFWEAEQAGRYMDAPDYPQHARDALKEMHRQVGDLHVDEKGVAQRGLLVRHLVMPNGEARTRGIMRFLRNELSVDTYVNIMPQYRPCHEALRFPLINRLPTKEEYREAIQIAREEGIARLDRRERRFLFRWE